MRRSWLVLALCLLCTIRLAGTTPAVEAGAPLPSLEIEAGTALASKQLQTVLLPCQEQLLAGSPIATPDGCLFCGQTYQPSGSSAAMVVRYDQAGHRLWSYDRRLATGDSSYNWATAGSAGLTAAFGRVSDRTNPELGLVSVFSSTGRPIWERQLAHSRDPNLGISFARGVFTADGGVIALGLTTVYNLPSNDRYKPLLAVKYDRNGRLLWQREMDLQGYLDLNCATLAADGSLYLSLCVYPDSPGEETSYPLIKLDSSGDLLWQLQLGDADYHYQVWDIACAADGSLLLAAKANYLGQIPPRNVNPARFNEAFRDWSYHPAAILRLDDSGEIAWRQLINGEFGASAHRLLIDGDTILAQVTLVDDAVPPPPWCSINVRPVTREVVVQFDLAGERLGAIALPADLASPILQGVEPNELRVIGLTPRELPQWEWSEPTQIEVQPAPEPQAEAPNKPNR